MSSLVSSYEYDIFISYRHNDNLDGWVTHFFQDLEKELKGTLKESLTIYFDQDPYDGLLETHNVDKSLEGKLKCLIFIPIISQTYCDTKSFAWQHEFCAFNKLVKEDLFGRDIKLSNGNVASRLLPIKIHYLDAEDKLFLENELGGVLRAIEFIYKEAGVNRPLKSTDNKNDNQNITDYRNQVNKVANAIKELIQALKNFGKYESLPTTSQSSLGAKIPGSTSIAVLPFLNMSNDPDQEYFSDGLTEEIITDLSKVKELLVISRSTIMTLKNAKKKIKDIANEVNVRYVLEGSVRKSGNSIRITAQLIDALADSHIWADKFNGTMEDVFDLQEKISRTIVNALKLKLTPDEDSRFRERPITNIHAYECLLHARNEIWKINLAGYQRAEKYLLNGIDLIGPNELLYGGMAYLYFNFANSGFRTQESLATAEDYVSKTLELNPKSLEGNLVKGLLYQTVKGNQEQAISFFNKALEERPNNIDALFYLCLTYSIIGKPTKSLALAEQMVATNPLDSNSQGVLSFHHFYCGDFSTAIHPAVKANVLDPDNSWLQFWLPFTFAYNGKLKESMLFIDKHIIPHSRDGFHLLAFLLKSAIQNEKEQMLVQLTESDLISFVIKDPVYSQWVASICGLAGLKTETLFWLENAVNKGFINYPFLALYDPNFQAFGKEDLFNQLMHRTKKEYEASVL